MTQSDSFDDEVRLQLENMLERWTPSDVEPFNATSWTNLISIAIGDGALDIGHVMNVTQDDRDMAIKVLRMALEAATTRRKDGLLGRIRERLGAASPDPIEFYKRLAQTLPPVPTREHVADHQGIPVYMTPEDPDRLPRHEALAALVLERCEQNPGVKPSAEDISGMLKAVGMRGRES